MWFEASLTINSDSARHRVSGHLPTYFSNRPEELYKISLIIIEYPGEILIKLAFVLKISKSSWKTD